MYPFISDTGGQRSDAQRDNNNVEKENEVTALSQLFKMDRSLFRSPPAWIAVRSELLKAKGNKKYDVTMIKLIVLSRLL